MNISQVKCNFCGKEMDEFDNLFDFSVSKRVGYGSIHDGDMLELKLCCSCFDKIMGSCAINPFIEEPEDDLLEEQYEAYMNEVGGSYAD